MLGWMHTSYGLGVELSFYISLAVTLIFLLAVVIGSIVSLSKFVKTLFSSK